MSKENETSDNQQNGNDFMTDVSGSYGVPENPTTTETGRTYWYENKLQKVFMKDVDGKVCCIVKK